MEALRTPGGLPATAGKVWAVLRITIASRASYLGELILRSGFVALVLFIFTALWRATGRGQDVPGLTGFRPEQLIWYLAFTQALVMATPGLFDPEVAKEVRSGDVAYRLARPLPLPLYYLGAHLGETLVRFSINLVVGCAVAWAVAGPMRLSPVAVGAALCAAMAAFIADWVWSFTVALASFWVEDTRGLLLLYRRGAQLLGGMLIPLDAYPDWLATIARALPFQYLIYRPARLFVQPDAAGFGTVIGMLALMTAIGVPLLWIVYRLGLRRVSAQGG